MSDRIDRAHMARALQLAARGRFHAAPNPHVGCVLVKDGVLIGEGFSQPAGGPHAEIEALRAAGDDARGATAYVTLEPCNHHGRTGPCSEALIDAGVARVVFALADPHPAAGGGAARLREAGIAVDSGLLEAEAKALVRGFWLRHRRGWGRVRAKLASSLDGRTAMASGESQWITGPAARADVQRLRAASGAIVCGIGTVLADDCSLTVREAEFAGSVGEAALNGRQPLRVVLDSELRTPPAARVLRGGDTLLLHREGLAADATTAVARTDGVTLAALPASPAGGLDLHAMLKLLAAREVNEILVESGPRLAGALLAAGLLDELIVYQAPCLLGSAGRPLVDLPLERMADKVPLALADQRRVGDDWRLTFTVTQDH
ncbi:bifunctional diaminohydroxyphosphoribosylaminopyrimidine deaminase/5-amino-6-(5-phosphoribosylamino)uracil reductase RibD [Pseudohaliea sp.]|uniref:bifunctional diaminohydroxyphosphoribosylaminopyrimidine deaminase/5-amino-6-(5-phosphoribosylamino)uracil reductase RibD n=1 Tax=Pseudohaliea sp. TaxID=2740289 RepID=UPI0032EB6DF5